MQANEFPTKANLMLAKSSLALGKQGYDLMDKKRNILIRELMELIEEASNIQSEIDVTFREAYNALQRANIEMGIRNVADISRTVPKEDSITIKVRSVMGTEIPLVEYSPDESGAPLFPFLHSKVSLDQATQCFRKVKDLTIKLSMIENAAYRLANSIKKTQRRANALQYITIPKFKDLVNDIQNALEEKEREEFTRLKVVKKNR